MKNLLMKFEDKAPEIVFEWHDTDTTARGWVVINSLRGGAAGGGTRMRRGLDRHEVESLAKTMEIKFTVSGPAIGGAKSGIDFDPSDPRKDDVLRRWFAAVAPLLRAYYGTGGDLNVDEMAEVVPITEANGLWHPQEGVVTGHFGNDERERIQRVGQLRLGVAKVVEDPRFTPALDAKYTVADLITGWGVAESVRHHQNLHPGNDLAGKRVVVQDGATSAPLPPITSPRPVPASSASSTATAGSSTPPGCRSTRSAPCCSPATATLCAATGCCRSPR